MPSHRIAQVDALIQKELGAILLRDFDVPPGVLLTITSVKTSEDRDHALVSVSMYPQEEAPALWERLERQRRNLQHALNRRLVMEHVPDILWKRDTGEAEAAEVEQLIDEVTT